MGVKVIWPASWDLGPGEHDQAAPGGEVPAGAVAVLALGENSLRALSFAGFRV